MRLSTLLQGGLRLAMRYCAVVIGTALLLHVLPGSPWSDFEQLPQSIKESLEASIGFKDPLFFKTGRALVAALTWQFGPSISYPECSCASIIWSAWPISFLIGLWTLAAAWPVSWCAACWLAAYPRRLHYARPLLSFFLSCPSFLVVGVAIWRGWATPLAPITQQLAVAVCCLFWIPFAQSTLYLARMLQREREEPYLQHALLQGLSPFQAMFQHALVPSLARLTSFLAPQAAALLTGSAAVEKSLCIPGLGSWFVDSVLQRDASMILALTACFTLTLLLASAAAETLRNWLDPRLAAFSQQREPLT